MWINIKSSTVKTIHFGEVIHKFITTLQCYEGWRKNQNMNHFCRPYILHFRLWTFTFDLEICSSEILELNINLKWIISEIEWIFMWCGNSDRFRIDSNLIWCCMDHESKTECMWLHDCNDCLSVNHVWITQWQCNGDS